MLLVVVLPLSSISPVKAPRSVFWQGRIAWIFCYRVENGREEPRRLEYPDSSRLVGKDVLEKVVKVSHYHPQKLDRDGLAQEEGEHHEDPRQVGGPKYQKAKEIHPYHGIPSGPDVHEHEGESWAQEELIDKESKKEHGENAEDEHHDKIRSASMERSLLQHPAVLVGEDHVEEKVKAEVSEEEECSDQSPDLELVDYQVWIEVELKRRE